jgi:hypothetical protein
VFKYTRCEHCKEGYTGIAAGKLQIDPKKIFSSTLIYMSSFSGKLRPMAVHTTANTAKLTCFNMIHGRRIVSELMYRLQSEQDLNGQVQCDDATLYLESGDVMLQAPICSDSCCT